jgi:putative inorganic carbon (hco3(-)) transporter
VAQRRVFGQAGERIGKACLVAGPDPGADDTQARCHRLKERDRQAFPLRTERIDVGGGQKALDIVASAKEADARPGRVVSGQKFGCKGLDLAAKRAVAHYPQDKTSTPGLRGGKCAHQQQRILLPRQPACRNHDDIFRRGAKVLTDQRALGRGQDRRHGDDIRYYDARRPADPGAVRAFDIRTDEDHAVGEVAEAKGLESAQHACAQAGPGHCLRIVQRDHDPLSRQPRRQCAQDRRIGEVDVDDGFGPAAQGPYKARDRQRIPESEALEYRDPRAHRLKDGTEWRHAALERQDRQAVLGRTGAGESDQQPLCAAEFQVIYKLQGNNSARRRGLCRVRFDYHAYIQLTISHVVDRRGTRSSIGPQALRYALTSTAALAHRSIASSRVIRDPRWRQGLRNVGSPTGCLLRSKPMGLGLRRPAVLRAWWRKSVKASEDGRSGPKLAKRPGAAGLNAALFTFVLATFPVFLRRPVWAAFAFAFLLVLHVNLVLSSRFSVGLADPLLFGAMLSLVAFYPLLHGDTGRGSGRFLAACGLWLVAVLNSYVWSTASDVSVGALQDFLPNLYYAGVLFLLVADRDRLIAALGGVTAATALLSLLTVLQVSLGLVDFDFYGFARGDIDHIAVQVDAIRPTGPVRDPNYYCQILIPGFALALGMALSGQTAGRRAVGLAVTVLILVAIMLTASRGGMLATAAATLVLLLAHRKIQYLAVVMVPVLALLYFNPSYLARVTSLTTSFVVLASGETTTESSVSGRLAEMEAAAILFAEHPVSGIGYGMFEGRYQDISANYDMVLRGEDRSAHSLYLETAAEQGAVGLAALLFLLGASLRSIRLASRWAIRHGDTALVNVMRAMGAAATGLFVSSLFLHDAYAQQFWLVLALLFAAERATGAGLNNLQSRVEVNG